MRRVGAAANVLDRAKYLTRIGTVRYRGGVVPGDPVPARSPSLALHEHAASNLSFIRDAMERAGSFTAVPGWGQAAIGATALAAAALAARAGTFDGWLRVWLAEAALAAGIGVAAMVRKARQTGVSLVGAPARKFAVSFTPPLVAGAVLTVALVRAGTTAALPGTWLLLYGAGVVCGGAFSVRIVPVTGGALMLAGAAALAAPPTWGDAFMAAGFGLVQVVAGALIARRHGG